MSDKITLWRAVKDEFKQHTKPTISWLTTICGTQISVIWLAYNLESAFLSEDPFLWRWIHALLATGLLLLLVLAYLGCKSRGEGVKGYFTGFYLGIVGVFLIYPINWVRGESFAEGITILLIYCLVAVITFLAIYGWPKSKRD